MRWIAAQVCLTAGFLTCLSGCSGSSAATYPSDPLFINKKPIEAKVENASPAAASQSEPAVPAIPTMVLAAIHREGTPGAEPTGLAQQPPTAAPVVPAHFPISPVSHTPDLYNASPER